jgi:hypothetical protein
MFPLNPRIIFVLNVKRITFYFRINVTKYHLLVLTIHIYIHIKRQLILTVVNCYKNRFNFVLFIVRQEIVNIVRITIIELLTSVF